MAHTHDDNHDLPAYIKVKKSPRAKRLALRLNTRERLFDLVIPRGISLTKAQAFAEEHDRWMKEKLRDLPRLVKFRNGAVVPVMGRNRTIRIVYSKHLRATEIVLKYNELLIFTNLEDPAARIVRFFKDLAKEHLEILAAEKADRIGKRVRKVSVRDTRSRWGSCAKNGHLCFSWRLIFAPPAAFDYVVGHEVAHLAHLDHGKDFWKLCRRLSGNYIEGEYWMRNHGHELMRYGTT